MIEDPMNDLRVGREKPLGYLPLSTIQMLGLELSEVRRKLQIRGAKILTLSADECHIGSGALYAYDCGSLAELLKKNEAILLESQWTTEPDDFVVRVAHRSVNEKLSPALYWLIAEAFADPRVIGKTRNGVIPI